MREEEVVVVELLRALDDFKGGISLRDEGTLSMLHNLAFLATHGVFDAEGRIVDVTASPRFGLEFIIYYTGVYSPTVQAILVRLMDKGILRLRGDGSVEIRGGERLTSIEARSVVEAVSQYAGLDAGELEKLVQGLLGLRSGTARVLVFGASVARLLEARGEVRRLRGQGMLVDV